jgi:hypothetical protein
MKKKTIKSLLIFLGIITLGAVGFIFFTSNNLLNFGTYKDSGNEVITEKVEKDEVEELSYYSLVGLVLEAYEEQNEEGESIYRKFVVQPIPLQDEDEWSEDVEFEIVEYKFALFEEESVRGEEIQAGDIVSVGYQGMASEEEYVVADKVFLMNNQW